MAPATGAEQAVVEWNVWSLSVRSLASAWFWENSLDLLNLVDGGVQVRQALGRGGGGQGFRIKNQPSNE